MCRRRQKHDTSEGEDVSQQTASLTHDSKKAAKTRCASSVACSGAFGFSLQLADRVISFLLFRLVMNISPLSYSVVSLNPDKADTLTAGLWLINSMTSSPFHYKFSDMFSGGSSVKILHYR